MNALRGKTSLDESASPWIGVAVTLGWIIEFSCSWLCGWWIFFRLRGVVAAVPGMLLPRSGRHLPNWSVIIPARNEELRLPRLLQSLKRLSHRPTEVLVVDDESTDRSAEVARACGAKVLPSCALPAGWRGKNWACHQASQVATGEVLVFLDADTWLTSDDLPLVERGLALALLPYHEVSRPDESASMFFNVAMAAGTVPDGLVGQSLIIHRDDYHASGGHAAVRGRILENFYLAQKLREHGCRVRCLPGRGRLSFRMYPGGWRELCPGWIKGFASGAAATPPLPMVMVVLWMIGLMMPWLWLVVGADVPIWLTLLVLGLAVVQVAAVTRLVGNFPWYASLAYPVTLGCFFGLFAISKFKGGRNVEWKGRRIDAT